MRLKDINIQDIKEKFGRGNKEEVFMKRLKNSSILKLIYVMLLKLLVDQKLQSITSKKLGKITNKDFAQCRIYLNFFEEYDMLEVLSTNGKEKVYSINNKFNYKKYLDELEV